MDTPADRNLLFGAVALQLGFIERQHLADAMILCSGDDSKSMERILRQRGLLTADQAKLVSEQLDRRVKADEGSGTLGFDDIMMTSSKQALAREIAETDQGQSLASVESADSSAHGDPAASALNRTEGGSQPSEKQSRFQIVRPHATGGLGAVFVAMDREIDRHVALKEIKPEYAFQSTTRTRFIAEARVTGRLEHPGIVPVYGLGFYADGRPYYAMRFIQGESLADAIRTFHETNWHRRTNERNLELRKLLGRFVDVCQAVGYAHDHGVIHRDLKPANIMLGKYGETLVVDWGLARAIEMPDSLSPELTGPIKFTPELTHPLTKHGSIIGTPQYMSPEQSRGNLGLLGPASDIYSLGATLYVILTGQPSIKSAPLAEIKRKIEGGEIHPPRSLDPRIPKPLEAICMMAMSVKPTDRYPSCAALANDIENWLADEPISAAKDNFPNRCKRWIRKHPGSSAAVAAAICVLMLASMIAVPVLVRANQREREAAYLAQRNAFDAREQHREAELQRQTAQSQKQEAERQRGLAEARQREALALRDKALNAEKVARESQADTEAFSTFLVQHVLAAARPKAMQSGLGENVTVQQALEQAQTQINRVFAGRPRAEATAREAIGVTWRTLGKYPKAIEHLRIALRLRLQEYKEQSEEVWSARNSLGAALAQNGEFSEAIELQKTNLELAKSNYGPKHQRTLIAMNNLGLAYQSGQRLELALQIFQETYPLMREVLGEKHTNTLTSLSNIGFVLLYMGRAGEAIPKLELSLKLHRESFGERYVDTIHSKEQLSLAYRAVGRTKEAMSLAEEALRDRQATLGSAHGNTVKAMADLAEIYRIVGRRVDSAKLMEEVIAFHKKALGKDARTTLNEMVLLAIDYRALGRRAESLALMEEALKLRRARFGNDHPETIINSSNVVSYYFESKEFEKAIPLAEEIIAAAERCEGQLPASALVGLPRIAGNVADHYAKAGKTELADKYRKLESKYKSKASLLDNGKNRGK